MFGRQNFKSYGSVWSALAMQIVNTKDILIFDIYFFFNWSLWIYHKKYYDKIHQKRVPETDITLQQIMCLLTVLSYSPLWYCVSLFLKASSNVSRKLSLQLFSKMQSINIWVWNDGEHLFCLGSAHWLLNVPTIYFITLW